MSNWHQVFPTAAACTRSAVNELSDQARSWKHLQEAQEAVVLLAQLHQLRDVCIHNGAAADLDLHRRLQHRARQRFHLRSEGSSNSTYVNEWGNTIEHTTKEDWLGMQVASSEQACKVRRARYTGGSTACNLSAVHSLQQQPRHPAPSSATLWAGLSCSTWRGKVAENMTVWRSGRMLLTMRLICGSKPMSNMRSASSST